MQKQGTQKVQGQLCKVIAKQIKTIRILNPSLDPGFGQVSLQTVVTLSELILQAATRLLEFRSKEYSQIEELLQRQENANRYLIKKEFQLKEYQKTLVQELQQQKKLNEQLTKKYSRILDQLRAKDIELLHLSNEKKSLQRDKMTCDSITALEAIEKRVQQSLQYPQLISKESREANSKSDCKKHSRRNSDHTWKRSISTRKIVLGTYVTS